MKLQWKPDEFAESRMKALGIKWETRTVPLKEINDEESLHNNARAEAQAINYEVVSDFAQAMRNGDCFPSIVLLDRKKDKYVLGGNHRIAALKEIQADEVGAYVVHSNDETAKELLPRILNAGHGFRQNRAEKLLHAIFAINKYGYTAKEAAGLFGLNEKTLLNAIRIQEVRTQLKGASIPEKQLVDTAVLALAAVKNEAVRNATARLMVNRSLATAAVHALTDEVNSEKRSEASQMAVIAKWENDTAEQVKSNGSPIQVRNVKRSRFLSNLTQLESTLKKVTSLSELQITDKNEAVKVKERIASLVKKLIKVAKISV